MAQRSGVRPTQLLGGDFRALATQSKRLTAGNIVYLVGVWAVVAAAFGLVATYPHPLVVAGAVLVVSGRQQALLNVQHECIHSLFLPGRRLNDLVGTWLCASPCGSPYWASKARHLAHHRLLGTDADPDGPLHAGPVFAERRSTVRRFATGVLGGYAATVLLGENTAVAVEPAQRRADRVHLVVTQVALWGATTVALAWWVYPVVWLLPLGTITVFTHQLRSFVEHAVVPGAETDLHPDRLVSIRSNPVELFMVAPYNMNYHAEHHLFPWVPAPRLPAVQQRLDGAAAAPERIRRSSYLGTLRRYLRALDG